MSEAESRPSLPFEIDPREFDDASFQRDPFPLYKRLRDHHPVFHDRFHNRWIITRYWDVDGCFQDNDSFDRAVYKPDGPYEFGSSHIFGPNILEYGNSPQHRWLRNIVAGQFVGQGLADFLPMVEKIAGEVVERFRGDGEVELVSQFSSQVPIRVISNMLGLPREDEETFVGWYQALIAGLGFGGEHLARGVAARNEMWDYLDPMIAQRTQNPTDDLLSGIVNAELDGGRMSGRRGEGVCRPAAGGGRGHHRQSHRQHVVPHALHAPRPVRGCQSQSGAVDERVYRDDAVRPRCARPVPAHHGRGADPRQGDPRNVPV